MPQLAKQGLAEGIGAFFLIFIGAGAILTDAFAGVGTGLLGIAFAHGLAIFIGVSATGHVSGGHLNPAVTVGFLVTGRITPATAAVYIVSQLVGAVVAAALLVIIFPSAVADAVSLGTPALGAGVTMWRGVLIEAVLTFILVMVIFQTAGHPTGPKAIAPLAIGLTIAADILMGGPLTGAAMNPARAFGPALLSGTWGDQLVYWIGPIIGGAAAALLAHFLIQQGKSDEMEPEMEMR